MASISHPVVGDTLYGAAGQLTDQAASREAPSKAARRKAGAPGDGSLSLGCRAEPERLRLGRNFLHAARLEFAHPTTGKGLELEAPLPVELESFLRRLDGPGSSSVMGEADETDSRECNSSAPIAKMGKP
jgi:23S rRNA pseudouridine1911/1915/1917 synthase